MTVKRLEIIDGKAVWIEIDKYQNSSTKNSSTKEDLTVDGYINKYGSIYNHADGKRYTTKKTYLDDLKQSGHRILDS